MTSSIPEVGAHEGNVGQPAPHTPLPWRVAPSTAYRDGDLNIDAGAKGFVCTAGMRGDGEAEANAALIVRAVNNHDAAVALLEVICNDDLEADAADGVSVLDVWRKEARNWLSKAKVSP